MGLDRFYELNERFFKLTADHRVGDAAEEIFRVERRIETVETNVTAGVEPANLFSHAQAESQRGVHWNRYPNEAGALNLVRIEAFDRNVHGFGVIPGPAQQPHWHCYARRLMPEFVAGDQENGSFDRYRHRWHVIRFARSEEHTSELQSLAYLVCRL